MAGSSERAKVLKAYKEALATAASVSAYAMLARGMAREFLPEELRAAVRWGASLVRSRLRSREKERHTIIIRRSVDNGSSNQNNLFDAARTYLATKTNPRSCVTEPDGSSSWRTLLSMEDGGSTADDFDGVEFRWTYMDGAGGDNGGMQ